jgi:hypothetical protein
MTEYMTIMWVTVLSGVLQGDVFGIVYMTEEACRGALSVVSNTLDYDHNLSCDTLPIGVELEP